MIQATQGTPAVGALDTANHCLVCVTVVGDRLVIRNPPLEPITPDSALVLAAWLVALAEPSPGQARFAAILNAVLST
jgi:hypothetical protein